MFSWLNSETEQRCEHGVLIGAWVFQKLVIYWHFPTLSSLQFPENKLEKISREHQFSGRKCLVVARGQSRITALLPTDRKSTQRATHYSQVIDICLKEETENHKNFLQNFYIVFAQKGRNNTSKCVYILIVSYTEIYINRSPTPNIGHG